MKKKYEFPFEIRIVETNEQGYPEIIEIKYKGKWIRYVQFSSELELEMTQFVKDSLTKI